MISKKGQSDTCGYTIPKERLYNSTLDESFLFYDSLVRGVFWIDGKERPVVRVTGSHNIHSCLFGAINMEGKQPFRHYGRFNGDTFLDFLRIIHHKFPRCHVFTDKAVSPHHRSRKAREARGYFDRHKDTLIPVYTFQPRHQSLW